MNNNFGQQRYFSHKNCGSFIAYITYHQHLVWGFRKESRNIGWSWYFAVTRGQVNKQGKDEHLDSTPGKEQNMLLLTRKVGEKLKIGDDVTVSVLGVKGGQIRIGIDAPRDVKVDREEVFQRIQKESETPSRPNVVRLRAWMFPLNNPATRWALSLVPGRLD